VTEIKHSLTDTEEIYSGKLGSMYIISHLSIPAKGSFKNDIKIPNS